MNDGDVLKSWQQFVKYPNLIPYMNPKVREVLDTLQELLPVVWDYDRLGTFLRWRSKAKDLGLINFQEYDAIGREMIDGCGGM
jgi:hypothetical protein